jgi:hypothetical protein
MNHFHIAVFVILANIWFASNSKDRVFMGRFYLVLAVASLIGEWVR